MIQAKKYAIGLIVTMVLLLPLILAAFSPLLAWRGPIYIISGFAGIIGLALLGVQPLLAGRYIGAISPVLSRQMHRIIGVLLLLSVLGHMVGLWITSPPDMIDALLLRSPTPFSIWGVLAMWALFGVALLAAFQKRLGFRYKNWQRMHVSLASFAALATVLHVIQIEGTMETVSKALLSFTVLALTIKVGFDRQIWSRRSKRD